jgi:hypothetical protein
MVMRPANEIRDAVPGCSVIQFPSGRWGFVGKVPVALAYPDATPDDVATISLCGPGIAKRIAVTEGRTLKEATFATEQDAYSALHAFAAS